MGTLKIRLIQAQNLKCVKVFGEEYKNCYVVFTFDKKRILSSVKDGTLNPVLWGKEYVIDNVPYPSSSNLAIVVVCKGEYIDKTLGVVVVSNKDNWIGDPVDQWLMLHNKEGQSVGEINVNIHWTKLEQQEAQRTDQEVTQEEARKMADCSKVIKSIHPILFTVHAGLLL